MDETKTLDEINDQDLNAWVSKIYIGILWKELELQFDRRNPEKGPIFPKEAMENFRMVHFFMQSCRKNMIFHALGDGFPNSLLRVSCKVPRDIQDQFDYLDNLAGHTVAVRMGNKGVLAMFDGGLHNMIFPYFSDRLFENKPLHGEQFKEIFAKITYKNLLSLRVPYYVFIQNQEADIYTVSVLAFDDLNKGASCLTVAAEGGPIVMVPILPDAALEGPAYGDWSQEEFARVLSTYTGIPFERLFVPPDLVRTSLRDDNGNFLDIPVEVPV
ncbi:hypothetical protein A4R29_09195 [Mesorhizobium ciceri biovar biserrulae]|nr:hypothetical protein A4R29_09195 [Mesorhizobium ciceri biovar biserrulae]